MKWSFYSEETGEFLSRVMSFTNDEDLKANTPQGYIAISGEYNAKCHRFDRERGEVVSFRPERPDENHEWNDQRKRWEKRVDVQITEAARADIQRQIDELEQKQHRRVRELLEESDPQLKALSQRIATLRSELSQPPVPAESSESVLPEVESPPAA